MDWHWCSAGGARGTSNAVCRSVPWALPAPPLDLRRQRHASQTSWHASGRQWACAGGRAQVAEIEPAPPVAGSARRPSPAGPSRVLCCHPTPQNTRSRQFTHPDRKMLSQRAGAASRAGIRPGETGGRVAPSAPAAAAYVSPGSLRGLRKGPRLRTQGLRQLHSGRPPPKGRIRGRTANRQPRGGEAAAAGGAAAPQASGAHPLPLRRCCTGRARAPPLPLPPPPAAAAPAARRPRAVVVRAAADNGGFAFAEGARVKVTTPIKVFHVPKHAEVELEGARAVCRCLLFRQLISGRAHTAVCDLAWCCPPSATPTTTSGISNNASSRAQLSEGQPSSLCTIESSLCTMDSSLCNTAHILGHAIPNLPGMEGTVKKIAALHKGMVTSATMEYRVQFQTELDGAAVKFFAHLVSCNHQHSVGCAWGMMRRSWQSARRLLRWRAPAAGGNLRTAAALQSLCASLTPPSPLPPSPRRLRTSWLPSERRVTGCRAASVNAARRGAALRPGAAAAAAAATAPPRLHCPLPAHPTPPAACVSRPLGACDGAQSWVLAVFC